MIKLNSDSLNFESKSFKRENTIVNKERPISSMSRPQTSRPQTSRPQTSRLNSARNRPGSSLSNFQSNLNREPSEALNKITMRETEPSFEYDQSNGIGDFLLLDVEESKENKADETKPRPKSSFKADVFKLSHQCKNNLKKCI